MSQKVVIRANHETGVYYVIEQSPYKMIAQFKYEIGDVSGRIQAFNQAIEVQNKYES